MMEDLQLIRKRSTENRVSLNQEKREAQMSEEKKRKEDREAERLAVKPSKEPRVFRIRLFPRIWTKRACLRARAPANPKKTRMGKLSTKPHRSGSTR